MLEQLVGKLAGLALLAVLRYKENFKINIFEFIWDQLLPCLQILLSAGSFTL